MSRKSKTQIEDEALPLTTEDDLESTAIDEEATPVVHSSVDDTRVDDLVNAWFNKYMTNSPVSRNTAAYNHLQDCLPHLVKALKE